MDGYRMYYNPELLEDLFDAKSVFDPVRPTPVPPMGITDKKGDTRMKKRALILTAVLTAAALTGGSGYLPVTDGIRSKMIQNCFMQMQRIQIRMLQTQKLLILCLIRQRSCISSIIMMRQSNLLKKQDDFTKNKDYMDLAAKCQIAKNITG